MLTLFSTPKPFRGKIATIQRNAIQSWTRLEPACQVILFGDDEGTAAVAAELGVQHIPDIKCDEHGIPLVNSLFESAQQHASYGLLCYVNADIILMGDFMRAVRRVQNNDDFLMVGQRWDLDVSEPLGFGQENWEEELRTQAITEGVLHMITGIDYFVFPCGLLENLPPFTIGRPGWDNWMLYRARTMGACVIDSTLVVIVIHQNHVSVYSSTGEGAKRNTKLSLDTGMSYAFTLLDATHRLTPFDLKVTLIRDPSNWQADERLLGEYRLMLSEIFQELSPSSIMNLVYKHIVASSYWYQADLELRARRFWAVLPNIWQAHNLVPRAYPWRRVSRRAWAEAKRALSRIA